MDGRACEYAGKTKTWCQQKCRQCPSVSPVSPFSSFSPFFVAFLLALPTNRSWLSFRKRTATRYTFKAAATATATLTPIALVAPIPLARQAMNHHPQCLLACLVSAWEESAADCSHQHHRHHHVKNACACGSFHSRGHIHRSSAVTGRGLLPLMS